MPFEQFDRRLLKRSPLSERRNRVFIERDAVDPRARPAPLTAETLSVLRETAARIRVARQNGRPVVLAFGAHLVKNGLGPLVIRMMEEGWVTHLATNGAGIIHDWEFAFLGESSEDVAENVAQGKFGIWEETGFNINLALAVGAWRGLGYGESVGALIDQDGLDIPSQAEVEQQIRQCAADRPEQSAAAADLLSVLRLAGVEGGRMTIPHPYKRYSIQAAAYRLRIPFTGHPMIGHDIIYTHPINHGGVIGRAAMRDFLTFAKSISQIEGGVYLSVGSAIMSPMIFEKSLSMAQNIAIQQGKRIEHHFIVVVDLAKATWDWASGEPPPENPAYYVRFCKTFSRMGGLMRYVSVSNKDFLLGLMYEMSRRPLRD